MAMKSASKEVHCGVEEYVEVFYLGRCRQSKHTLTFGSGTPLLAFVESTQELHHYNYGFTLTTNDAKSFSHHVLLAIFSVWLLYGDILVLDNATIHNGGLNLDLENWLWSNFRIYLLYLPASTPEWNPIELVWNILVQRLNVFCIDLAKPNGWREQPQPCCCISYCFR